MGRIYPVAGELGRTKAVLASKHGDDRVMLLFLNIHVSAGEQKLPQAWLWATPPRRQPSPELLLRFTEAFSLGSSRKFRGCFAFQIYELFCIWNLLLNKGSICSVGWRINAEDILTATGCAERQSWRKWPREISEPEGWSVSLSYAYFHIQNIHIVSLPSLWKGLWNGHHWGVGCLGFILFSLMVVSV